MSAKKKLFRIFTAFIIVASICLAVVGCAPEPAVATGIKIDAPPTKTEYIVGQSFDVRGMKVFVEYGEDADAVQVADFTYSPNGELAATDTKITVSWGEFKAEQAITVVAKAVTSIAVTKSPTKTSYFVGQTFDKTGMVVTATYNDGSTAAVTDYTISKTTALAASDTSITVTHEGKTDTVAISVNAVTLAGIAITKAPDAVEYFEGDVFDKTGMVVTATYSDGSIAPLADYSISKIGELFVSDTQILVTSGKFFAAQAITVRVSNVTSVAVTASPTKLSYIKGDTFDKTGLEVTATYNDGTPDGTTSGYKVYPTVLGASDKFVTVSFRGASTQIPVYVADVTQISTAAEFSAALNNSTRTGYYFLANDIDFAGAEIPSVAGNGLNNVFRGVFDGNGYTLSNFKIAPTTGGDAKYDSALFAGTGYGAIIRNVSIVGYSTASVSNRSGIIVGTPRGGTIVENCYLEGTINQELGDTWGRSGTIFGGTDGSPINNSNANASNEVFFRNIISKATVTGNVDNVFAVGRIGNNDWGNTGTAAYYNGYAMKIDNTFVVTDGLSTNLNQESTNFIYNSTNSALTGCVTNFTKFAMADIATVDFSTLPSDYWTLNAGGMPTLKKGTVPATTAFTAPSASMNVTEKEMFELNTRDALWFSSNPHVAYVDQYGEVTAIASGKTDILAVTRTNRVAMCSVDVVFDGDVALNNMKAYSTASADVSNGQLKDNGFFTRASWLGYGSDTSGTTSGAPTTGTDGEDSTMTVTSATTRGRINALSVIRVDTAFLASRLIYNIGDQKMLGKNDGIVYNYTIMVKATGGFAISNFQTGGTKQDLTGGTGINYIYENGAFSVTHSLNNFDNVAITPAVGVAADADTGFTLNEWHRLDFTYVAYGPRIYSAFYVDCVRVEFEATGNVGPNNPTNDFNISTTLCENGNINFSRQVSGTHGPRTSFVVFGAGELVLKYAKPSAPVGA